jgi:hypothetical protein
VGLLESIRRWVDGESGQDPLRQADQQAQQTRRIWEEFLVKIAREVEAVMQREMFTPPGGPTYIPREYIVFLSNDDDKDWQGEKRRGLLQGLHHVLLERARELSGKTKLAAKSFAVELRIDGTLTKGEFRVQAVWDESESGKTNVQPRVQSQLAQTMLPESIPQIPTAVLHQEASPHRSLETTPDKQLQDDDTLPIEKDTDDEEAETDATLVRPRISLLYQMEIWRNGVRQTVLPVSKPEISIGRGSRSTVVDLPIKGDPEVSRVHATLFRDESGSYWLTPKGRNATLLNGRELQRDQSVIVRPDDKIQICSYVLRIQPQ